MGKEINIAESIEVGKSVDMDIVVSKFISKISDRKIKGKKLKIINQEQNKVLAGTPAVNIDADLEKTENGFKVLGKINFKMQAVILLSTICSPILFTFIMGVFFSAMFGESKTLIGMIVGLIVGCFVGYFNYQTTDKIMNLAKSATLETLNEIKVELA